MAGSECGVLDLSSVICNSNAIGSSFTISVVCPVESSIVGVDDGGYGGEHDGADGGAIDASDELVTDSVSVRSIRDTDSSSLGTIGESDASSLESSSDRPTIDLDANDESSDRISSSDDDPSHLTCANGGAIADPLAEAIEWEADETTDIRSLDKSADDVLRADVMADDVIVGLRGDSGE